LRSGSQGGAGRAVRAWWSNVDGTSKITYNANLSQAENERTARWRLGIVRGIPRLDHDDLRISARLPEPGNDVGMSACPFDVTEEAT
jgi:hypothetical protein